RFVVVDRYFFFQAEDGIRDRNVTGVQTCALPISPRRPERRRSPRSRALGIPSPRPAPGIQPRPRRKEPRCAGASTPSSFDGAWPDRKSTRLNSSHVSISYAVFCLKKKKT